MATYYSQATAQVGDRLYNNDPRIVEDDPRKIVTVAYVTPTSIGYKGRSRLAWIKFTRIFTDSKSRHQGYNLLPRGDVTNS